jgi:hypothetical protein
MFNFTTALLSLFTFTTLLLSLLNLLLRFTCSPWRYIAFANALSTVSSLSSSTLTTNLATPRPSQPRNYPAQRDSLAVLSTVAVLPPTGCISTKTLPNALTFHRAV